MRRLFPSFLFLLLAAASYAEDTPRGIYDPRHGYFTQPPQDRLARLQEEIAAGRRRLETAAGPQEFLRSLLAALEVPESSQTLVYSVTSLQKNLISPRRPRALYFNEDTYVGYVPEGRVEVIATDPQLGNIFYIFDRLAGTTLPRLTRSEDCMNCHAPSYLGNIPALSLESVVPGMSGGGERAFRRQQSGHGVPLEMRFGGWHVTGAGPGFPRNQGNLVIVRRQGEVQEVPNPPGTFFDLGNYLRPTSDVLPQLLQEHQVGFVNRALQAGYAARALEPGPEQASRLAALAVPLVGYLLFADEAAFPAGAVTGEAEYRADFLRGRRATADGKSLRDFDLSSRLFRYRCSYMIYSPTFTGLPAGLKGEVLRQLRTALEAPAGAAEFAYLGGEERGEISRILRETLPEFAL